MAVVMRRAKGSKTASAPASKRPNEPSDGLWDRIARKAYELWDTRGRREGYDLQDWLDAEEIVMDEIHEARE
jgi:hypothetical protein